VLKEFKEFAVKGNMVDMAVGIIVGAAFGAIVGSLVSDVLMPPLGLLLGNVDFSNLFLVLKEGKTLGPHATIAAAKGAGAVTLNYGLFVNTIVNFLIIAFALTILFGALSTFLGFLLLSRLPSPRGIRSEVEYGNAFVILVEDGERR